MTCRSSSVVVALLLGALSGPGVAQSAPAGLVTTESLKAHVDFLASDVLEGRDAGSPAAEIAALYVETQFRRLGLQPLGDHWQTSFPLPGVEPRTTALVGVGDVFFASSELVAAANGSANGSVVAPLALAGQDVRDRIAIAESRESAARARELFSRGALAVVFFAETAVFAGREVGDLRRKGGVADALGEFLAAASRGEADELTGEAPEVFQRMFGRAPSGDSGEPVASARPPAAGPVAAGSSGDRVAPAIAPGPVVLLGHALRPFIEETLREGRPCRLEVIRGAPATSTNVLARIEGSDPVLREEYVLAGAHYDHVGKDAYGNVWNGADDNASGVAALLEMAAALAAQPVKPRRSIVLAAWGAEERGLVGSSAFARDPPFPLERIAACINLDMIGRNPADAVNVLGASSALKKWAKEQAESLGLHAQDGPVFFLRTSDCAPFVQHQVPTVFFFSGIHEDYHQPSDDPEKLDADKACRVAKAALGVLLAAANADTRPDFEPPVVGAATASGRRTLGVVEARRAGSDGFLVASVQAGSIADLAGVKSGDTIVRIGDHAVRNVRDLRAALAARTPGVAFALEVRRNGETVVLEARFPETGR